MPATANEIRIVIEAQDLASRQLQQIGREVARLEQQIAGVQRGAGSGGLLGGLSLGTGFAAAQAAIGGIGAVIAAVKTSVIDLNSALEVNRATFEQVTGSVGAAQAVVAALRREAATSPFSDSETLAAGRALITVAEGSTDSLLHLVRVAEELAAIDPAQGLAGASAALREAVSGDFASVAERFELSRQSLQRFKESGLTNLQAVEAELERMGITSEVIERMGRTFQGRAATIGSFFDELRQRLGEGTFERISELFGHMVNLIAQHGDRLRQLASEIGQTIGGLLQGVATAAQGPLRALVETFSPGLWETIQQELSRVPEQVERTTQATQRAAAAGEDWGRQLGRIGVEAADLQLQADRLRRGYADQLEPLERQLRLLQQSADLQRVQSALASNRARVEGIRLDAEIRALEAAAGGMTDPLAAGLTSRQRAIALALEERQLRREELRLQEEQRPAIQTLEQRIAAVQEEQRKALEPLERALAIRKDEADALRLTQQRAEVVRQELEKANEASRKAWQADNAPEAVESARQRGEELAKAWLKGFEDWVNAGGGTVWGALGKSLDDWWKTAGRPQAIRVGAELGTAVGAAAGYGLRVVLGPQLKTLQNLEGFVTGLQQRVDALGQTADRVGTALGPVLGTTPPPNPGADLARINPFAGGGGGGGSTTTVNIAPNGVTVQSTGATAADLRRSRDETIAAITEAFTVAEASTDAGATRQVQGAGR